MGDLLPEGSPVGSVDGGEVQPCLDEQSGSHGHD
jgi:hypothetical protein